MRRSWHPLAIVEAKDTSAPAELRRKSLESIAKPKQRETIEAIIVRIHTHII